MKKGHKVYLTDDMYLPISYKGIKEEKPVYEGNGEHSIAELEALCNQYEEYIHQQQVIKQNCMKYIVELKFGVMNKYQVYIDVPQDDEWENIDVETEIVEANTPQEAEEKTTMRYSDSGVDFYVWEVTEEDKID